MMKKDNSKEISRRGFLKMAALTGAAVCIEPTLSKAMSAERILQGEQQSAKIPDGMAAVRTQRELGSGKAALSVSAIGFGCMGLNHHRSQHPGEEACIRLIHDAIGRGVTLFDTAESYGPFINEDLVGKALRGYADRVYVSSKFSYNYIDPTLDTKQNIRRACENSLRRLGVEAIGIYYQHRARPNVPIEEVAEAMAELIKEGKILHWGMCEVNEATIRRAHSICALTAIQSEYHLMYRNEETNGVLATCEELGIGFVPYSPVNRGFLCGAINEYTKFDPSNDNRIDSPRFQPDAIRANTRIVEVLNAFGRTRGITPAQIALAWLMNRHPCIVPIPGTTKLSHLEEDLRASEIVFSSEEMRELEKAVEAIPVIGNRYNAAQEAKSQK